jgi:hypothetical protein
MRQSTMTIGLDNPGAKTSSQEQGARFIGTYGRLAYVRPRRSRV